MLVNKFEVAANGARSFGVGGEGFGASVGSLRVFVAPRESGDRTQNGGACLVGFCTGHEGNAWRGYRELVEGFGKEGGRYAFAFNEVAARPRGPNRPTICFKCLSAVGVALGAFGAAARHANSRLITEDEVCPSLGELASSRVVGAHKQQRQASVGLGFAHGAGSRVVVLW